MWSASTHALRLRRLLSYYIEHSYQHESPLSDSLHGFYSTFSRNGIQWFYCDSTNISFQNILCCTYVENNTYICCNMLQQRRWPILVNKLNLRSLNLKISVCTVKIKLGFITKILAWIPLIYIHISANPCPKDSSILRSFY